MLTQNFSQSEFRIDQFRKSYQFYRAAAMQQRSFGEQSVRPSVERVNCDKTKETSPHILIRKIDASSCLYRGLPRIFSEN